MARSWFSYDGSGSTTSVDNYIYSPATPTCLNGRRICAVYGVNNGTQKPAAFSTNLQNYIATATATGVPQPALPASAKKYVYLIPS